MLLTTGTARAQYNYRTRNGKVTITRYTGSSGSVTIPATIRGRPVTEIGAFAFSGNRSLTNLTMGSRVTRIARYAFYGCTNLALARMGNGVRSIEDQAFRYCSGLTNIALGSRVQQIGSYAFGNCMVLDNVVFPNSLTNIGTAAFIHAKGLTTLRIRDRVRTIGNFAFYGCSQLASVSIGYGTRTIGASAFNQCTNLARVIVGTDRTRTRSNLSAIGNYAFRTCPNLTGVYFYGNYPRFGKTFHSRTGAKTLLLYRYRSATRWPSRVQSHRVVRFSRLPAISVTPGTQTVSHLAVTTTVRVARSGDGPITYEASSSVSWLDIVSGGRGTNGGTISVALTANHGQARTGIVTVVSAEATNSPRTALIIQPRRPNLQVDPNYLRVSHAAGTANFAIANSRPGGTMTYSAVVDEDDAAWLGIAGGGSGGDSGTLTVAFAVNNSVNPREGTIEVTAPDALNSPQSINIVQEGRPVLAVTPGITNVDFRAGNAYFNFDNVGGGTLRFESASSSPNWLRISAFPTGAEQHGTIQVAFDPNPNPVARTGVVTVAVTPADAANNPAQVQVVQSGCPALSVTPPVTNVNENPGTATFTVANTGGGAMAYTASVSVAWLAITGGASGTNAGTITVAYEASLAEREGSVTVTAPDAVVPVVNVTVHQSGVGSRRAADSKPESKPASGVEGSAPVAVVTSDDAAPVFESGWAAVDGDPATGWTAQKAGAGFIAVEYGSVLDLRALDVDLGAGSPTNVAYLFSADGDQWQPLPDDLQMYPVTLNYLWLVFPGDGTDAVPQVMEIRPNP